MTQIRPLHDRVVIRRIEEQDQKIGGLYIPDTAKEKPVHGEVVAVGDGRVQENGQRQPLDLKVGERVLFGKYSGTEIKLNEEELLILRESEVLGVVEGALKTLSARS